MEDNQMDYAKESLKKHYEWKGKIEIKLRAEVDSAEALSLAYTPGVAQPCLEIQKDINKSYELTRRWNTVAVVTDGSAVLGLGDIGPEAGMPVMEGKCALFKAFGDVDAIPICVKTHDVDEIVKTVSLISGSFGGINLEDIAAPRCFEIERKLKERLDIPVFHDDQHGTAIVLLAAVINALKIVDKKIGDIRIVINGAGSAGTAIGKLLMSYGAKNVVFCDRKGILTEETALNDAQKELASITNPEHLSGELKDALNGADVFIGVSVGGCVSEEMVKSMNHDACVFPMANPTPEIMPDLALKAGARVVSTGRSDFPNQINNLLVFPGIFRGALDVRAKDISEGMQLAAAEAIAAMIKDEELNEQNIIPSVFHPEAAKTVAKAVADKAREEGIARL